MLTIDVDPLDSTDIPKSKILENTVRRLRILTWGYLKAWPLLIVHRAAATDAW